MVCGVVCGVVGLATFLSPESGFWSGFESPGPDDKNVARKWFWSGFMSPETNPGDMKPFQNHFLTTFLSSDSDDIKPFQNYLLATFLSSAATSVSSVTTSVSSDSIFEVPFLDCFFLR